MICLKCSWYRRYIHVGVTLCCIYLNFVFITLCIPPVILYVYLCSYITFTSRVKRVGLCNLFTLWSIIVLSYSLLVATRILSVSETAEDQQTLWCFFWLAFAAICFERPLAVVFSMVDEWIVGHFSVCSMDHLESRRLLMAGWLLVMDWVMDLEEDDGLRGGQSILLIHSQYSQSSCKAWSQLGESFVESRVRWFCA